MIKAATSELCVVVAGSILDPNHKEKFDKLRGAKDKHRWIVATYERLPVNARRQLPDGIDISLTGIYDLIRRQRNELGHPQATRLGVDRARAFASFQLFPTFLRDAEAFATYCRANGV